MAELDPSIILQGQPVNVLGAMDSGFQLAQRRNEMQRQREYQNMLATNGAGILSGDQNALNALAGFDPQAAMGIQGQRLDMARTQQGMAFDAEEMQMRRETAKREAERYAATLSAEEAQAQAAQIEKAVAAGMAAQSPEQWDALVTQMGATDLVGQFGNRQAIAYTYMGVADALKASTPATPEWRAATPEEAAAYGAQAGQVNTKTGKFDAQNPPRGMSIETGPDGQLRVTEGPGVTGGAGKPFTEAQSKDNVYATRARGAMDALDPVANELTSRWQRAADWVPFGFGREMQTDNFQVAQQAGLEFLQAILRKDTGAAITQQETESYGITYLPQPGDNAAVLRAKKEARIRAVNALESGMSPAQMLARDSALVKAARETAGAQPANTAAPEAGSIVDGYRFKGGDPANPDSWEPAN
jgi:hypothetical protein